MNKLLRLSLAGLALVAGFWLYQRLFPRDEDVIRRELQQLAATASVRPGDSTLIRLGGSNKLVQSVTADVVLNLSDTGTYFSSIQGRDQLRETLMAARASVQQVEIEFVDVTVGVAPDRLSANALLTVIVHLNGERNSNVMEVRMDLSKVEGDWLISRVETVKPLRR